MLRQLIDEVPTHEICEQFKITQGKLESMQTAASTLARLLSGMAAKLRWHDMATLTSAIADRIKSGVRSELLPLMQVPTISAQQARQLCRFGISTVEALACSTPANLRRPLLAAIPRAPKHVKMAQRWTRVRTLEADRQALKLSACACTHGAPSTRTRLTRAKARTDTWGCMKAGADA